MYVRRRTYLSGRNISASAALRSGRRYAHPRGLADDTSDSQNPCAQSPDGRTSFAPPLVGNRVRAILQGRRAVRDCTPAP
jgi:hypothetical protein